MHRRFVSSRDSTIAIVFKYGVARGTSYQQSCFNFMSIILNLPRHISPLRNHYVDQIVDSRRVMYMQVYDQINNEHGDPIFMTSFYPRKLTSVFFCPQFIFNIIKIAKIC